MCALSRLYTYLEVADKDAGAPFRRSQQLAAPLPLEINAAALQG